MRLERHISLTEEVINAPNLTGRFLERDLDTIGEVVLKGYKADDDSRTAWKRRSQAALDLAMQLQEGKTFPWAGCANVKFPLVTVAAIQWHSRAYPHLLQGPEIVKMQVVAPDPTGELLDRARRVGNFMSYQLLEDSPSWEPETDRALIQLPIVGCAFKKTYYSAAQGRNCSDLVSAQDLVLNYNSKSVEDCPRKTHRIKLLRNEVYERIEAGLWRDVRNEGWYCEDPSSEPTEAEAREDRRTGQQQISDPDPLNPYRFLEQHVRMDLDGDGYDEPYVITVEERSGCVARIMANFGPEDVLRRSDNSRRIMRIRETQWFTKYTFLPSPDGGIYDVGFGILLGPINQAVDSLINQLLDAGTLATTAGGFLGRGVKIRGGEYSFRPFGWQRVDSSGEDLAKGIFPFPVREPSAVLFNLLGLLVDYTNRVSGATDIMVGENPGQNTPATTSQLMAEQGAKINTAIFKRVWRCLKLEFQKLYLLNRRHTPVTILRYGESPESNFIRREDFIGSEEAIRPVADPNLASDGARVQQALMIKQQAATTPGYDRNAVERNLLRAMKVEGMDSLFRGIESTPPPKDPRIAVEELKQSGKMQIQEASLRHKAAEKFLQMQLDRPKVAAEIRKLEAEIAEIISQIGATQAASQVAAFEARINALKAIDESFQRYLELSQQVQQNAATTAPSESGGASGLEASSGDGVPPNSVPIANGGAVQQLSGGALPPNELG